MLTPSMIYSTAEFLTLSSFFGSAEKYYLPILVACFRATGQGASLHPRAPIARHISDRPVDTNETMVDSRTLGMNETMNETTAITMFRHDRVINKSQGADEVLITSRTLMLRHDSKLSRRSKGPRAQPTTQKSTILDRDNHG